MSLLELPAAELRFLEKLNGAGIRYLVIGGFAVKFYGCRRVTEDVDLLVDSALDNARKLYPFIVEALGYRPAFNLEELSSQRKQLKMPNTKIDILTSSDVIEFSVAYERRECALENGVIIPIISRQDLISIKKEAAKDPSRKENENVDIDCLERIFSA